MNVPLLFGDRYQSFNLRQAESLNMFPHPYIGRAMEEAKDARDEVGADGTMGCRLAQPCKVVDDYLRRCEVAPPSNLKPDGGACMLVARFPMTGDRRNRPAPDPARDDSKR